MALHRLGRSAKPKMLESCSAPTAPNGKAQAGRFAGRPKRRSTGATSSSMGRFHHLAGDLGLVETLRLTLLPGSNDSRKVAR